MCEFKMATSAGSPMLLVKPGGKSEVHLKLSQETSYLCKHALRIYGVVSLTCLNSAAWQLSPNLLCI